MKILAFRLWKMPHELAFLHALEEYAEEQHVSTGTRIILLRRVSDPYPHHDLISRLRDTDIPFISITERDAECDDNSPEIQKAVKRWDEIIASNKLAEEHYRKQRMSGRNQMVLEDTIVHVNGVPFILRAGMRIEGNTDLRWAAALTTPITEKFDVAHDAQHITERREYERLHPVPELTDEEKRMILGTMYDPNNIGGHT
jgi:hypothetical protein